MPPTGHLLDFFHWCLFLSEGGDWYVASRGGSRRPAVVRHLHPGRLSYRSSRHVSSGQHLQRVYQRPRMCPRMQLAGVRWVQFFCKHTRLSFLPHGKWPNEFCFCGSWEMYCVFLAATSSWGSCLTWGSLSWFRGLKSVEVKTFPNNGSIVLQDWPWGM